MLHDSKISIMMLIGSSKAKITYESCGYLVYDEIYGIVMLMLMI